MNTLHITSSQLVSRVDLVLLRDLILAPSGAMTIEQMRAKQGDLLRLRDAFKGYDPRS